MTVRRIVLLVVIGVLAGVAAWQVGQLGGGSEPDGAAPPLGASSESASGNPEVAPPTAPSGSPSSSGSTSRPSPGAPGGLPSTPAPGRPTQSAPPAAHGSAGGGLEALPQPSSAPSQHGLPLPHGQHQGPLVSRPLPAAAYGKGRVVAGYPAALRPPRGSTVETSSVSPAGGTLQVALTARCSRPCDVLRHYRVELGARGFHEVDTPSVANAPAASLRRGDDTGSDTVSVTVTSRKGSTIEYAVWAILHTEA